MLKLFWKCLNNVMVCLNNIDTLADLKISLLPKFFSSFRNKNNKYFKDVLNGKQLSKPSNADPCCRIRFIAMADVIVFSYNDYNEALKNASSWSANTIVAVASGKVFELFIKKILPKVNTQIVLLVLDYPFVGTDSSVNNSLNVLENFRVKHLFAENWSGKDHPKLSILPIGVESPFPDGSVYGKTSEKQMLEFSNRAKLPGNKPLRILVNAHLNTKNKPASGSYNQRFEMEQILKANPLCDFWTNRESRDRTWELHENYAFELCPEGNGLDTHRFYEALWLNTIPIVKRNSLSKMYSNFPCVIVDNWQDINESMLREKLDKYNIEKKNLEMGTYMDLIQSKKIES